MSAALVQVRGVHKYFTRGSERIEVLKGVNLDIPPTTVPNFVDDPDHHTAMSGDVVPCKGNGPLQFGSVHPTNRDCSPPPPVSMFNMVAWVTK